jgi:Outer membrane protein beta-barrel domain
MTSRRLALALTLVAAVAAAPGESRAQEIVEQPILLELGGTPGGGLFFTGGDDNAEANFNVYTFSGNAAYYVTQRVALEGEYLFGNGWGQDIVFRNGLLVGQQTPFSHAFTGGVQFYPRGATGTRFPFYIGGGIGLMSMVARPTTKKIGYDPDGNGSASFMLSRIGAGVKLPRRASAPNWSFRLDYRLLFINSNDDAPQFFASEKRRTGHQFQFGIHYALRR